MNIVPYDKFRDDRGQLYTCWDEKDFDIKFVQDRVSRSKFNTIRGFHGDWKTWKLITCLYGKLKLVTYDLKEKQKEYIYLNSEFDEDCKTVLVPPGILNAHQVLSNEAVLHYKWSERYSGPENQISIHYNDPDIDPQWEKFCWKPTVSPRDLEAPLLKEYYESQNFRREA